jgi:hypothetical protein
LFSSFSETTEFTAGTKLKQTYRLVFDLKERYLSANDVQLKEYMKTLKQSYNSSIENVNFSDDHTRRDINKWLEDQTYEKNQRDTPREFPH